MGAIIFLVGPQVFPLRFLNPIESRQAPQRVDEWVHPQQLVEICRQMTLQHPARVRRVRSIRSNRFYSFCRGRHGIGGDSEVKWRSNQSSPWSAIVSEQNQRGRGGLLVPRRACRVPAMRVPGNRNERQEPAALPRPISNRARHIWDRQAAQKRGRKNSPDRAPG